MTEFTFKFESRESKEHSARACSLLTVKGIEAVGNYLSLSPDPRLIASWVHNFTDPLVLFQVYLSGGVSLPDPRRIADMTVENNESWVGVSIPEPDLETASLYARIREHCKNNPVSVITPEKDPGGATFKYDADTSQFIQVAGEVSIRLGALPASGVQIKIAKSRQSHLLSGILDAPFVVGAFKDLSAACRKTWEQVEAVKARGSEVPLVFADDVAFSQYPRGETPVMYQIDEWPFFAKTDDDNKRIDLNSPDRNHYLKEVEPMKDVDGSIEVGMHPADPANSDPLASGQIQLRGAEWLTMKAEYDVQASAMGQQSLSILAAKHSFAETTLTEVSDGPSPYDNCPRDGIASMPTSQYITIGNSISQMADCCTIANLPPVSYSWSNVNVKADAAVVLQSYLAMFGEPGEIEINKQFFENVRTDPEYAWSWHCNIACPLMDSGLSHEVANHAAARLMQHIFKIDMTQHPYWGSYQTQWAAEKAAPVQAVVDSGGTVTASGKHWTQF